MKITAVETIRLERYRQQLWLRVHTDEGLIGLGETCIGPLAVEAHVHETIAPHLIGKDPRQYGFDFGLWTRQIVAQLIGAAAGATSISST